MIKHENASPHDHLKLHKFNFIILIYINTGSVWGSCRGIRVMEEFSIGSLKEFGSLLEKCRV